MPGNDTLPQITIDDPSTAAVGTIFGGAFSATTIEETGGQGFIVLGRNVTLTDAVATTTAGVALTQDHALLVCVGHINNVVAVLRGADLTPGSAQRHAPAIKLPAGVQLFFKGVQLSGAQEAARWRLYWA